MECSKGHSLLRAIERYGLAFDERHLEDIVKKIQRGEGRFIAERRYKSQEWNIHYLHRMIRVIYDPFEQRLRTILPPAKKRIIPVYAEKGRSFRHNGGNTHSKQRRKHKMIIKRREEIEEEERGDYDAAE